MKIRPATRSDLAAIDELERAVFTAAVHPSFFFRQAHDLWPEWLLVASDTSLQGYALGAPACAAGEAWLLSMAVAESARGRGLGRALLAAMTATLRGAGVAQLKLTVHPDNPARRLYEKAGFRTIADESDYFHRNDPRLVMALHLHGVGPLSG